MCSRKTNPPPVTAEELSCHFRHSPEQIAGETHYHRQWKCGNEYWTAPCQQTNLGDDLIQQKEEYTDTGIQRELQTSVFRQSRALTQDRRPGECGAPWQVF